MSRTSKILIQGIIVIVIIAIGVTVFTKLNASRKAIERKKPEVPLPLVRTISVTTGPLQIILTGQGTVKPVQEIQLVPEVSGKVIELAPTLVNGGMFKKGERLLSIDPVDYEIAVTLAKARVKEAESRYQLAYEESAAAGQEWRRHNRDEEPPPLVAKVPQLAAARSLLEAEQANLKAAQLNLKRTRITAPFNGRVIAENVDIGQYISPGQSLATLHATDTAEIVVPLKDKDLYWFDVPGFTSANSDGASAEVRATVAGQEFSWTGRVVRSEGRINELSRMHNIVVQVENPYGSIPPLAAGQFVEIRIHGRTIDRAAVIPRPAMHENQTVWVVEPKDSTLHFRKVDVARTNHAGIVIQGGLTDGDRVVISSLKAVSDGMKVRNVDSNSGRSS